MRGTPLGVPLSAMGYMGVYKMGVIGNLTVEWHVHSDGCTILTWQSDDEFLNIDGCERYPRGTGVARALRSLAAYCAAVDRGERDSEALWCELELPFDTEPPS